MKIGVNAVRCGVLGLAMTVVTTVASAQVFMGTTVGGPTFNRPTGGAPPTTLSGVGTAVRYSTQAFFTGTSGSYVFQSVATAPANWDNFTLLYRNVFNPASPLLNALVANDDNPTIGLSGFTFNLVAGTQYIFVTTGFGNTDFGAFTNTITGPANVTFGTVGVIPEPSTYALMATGLVGLVGVARRRRSV